MRGSHCFETYWASGRAAATGLNPYAALPFTGQSPVFFNGHVLFIKDLNLNPPCVLLLLQAMSRLTYTQFGIAWTIASVSLLIASIGLLLRRRPGMELVQVLFLALAAPVTDTIFGGQIYFLLMFLSTLVLILDEKKREFAAAIALGILVAIKPTVAFWPIFLLLSGRRRLALRSMFVTTLVSILPLLIYGRTIYTQWLAALKNDPHWMVPTDIAIMAVFQRLKMHNIGVGCASVVAVSLAWIIWRKRPSMEVTSGIALCAVILCAPLAWYDYTLMLAPALVGHRWNKLETLAAVLLMIPPITDAIFRSAGPNTGITAVGLEGLLAVCIMLATAIHRVNTRTSVSHPIDSHGLLRPEGQNEHEFLHGNS
jgi:hypothetical protein